MISFWVLEYLAKWETILERTDYAETTASHQHVELETLVGDDDSELRSPVVALARSMSVQMFITRTPTVDQKLLSSTFAAVLRQIPPQMLSFQASQRRTSPKSGSSTQEAYDTAKASSGCAICSLR